MPIAKLILHPGVHIGENSNQIIIDGTHFENMVYSVSLIKDLTDYPKITLELVVDKCEVFANGEVFINDVRIPDSIAYQVYERLKEKFE